MLDLAERRLGWLDNRQRVLANNAANVDTPHYRGRDLAPFGRAFGRAFGQLGLAPAGVALPPGQLAATENGALQPTAPPGRLQAGSWDVALDKELAKVADAQTDQSLAISLYTKYLGLFRAAPGRSS